MKHAGLIAQRITKAAPLLLGLALVSGAQARDASISIRLKAVKGRIETLYRGKILTDAKFAQLCAAGKARKAEVDFQRDKMNSSDTMTALLKEADCLGAPKSATQTHARPRRTKGTPP